MLTPMGRYYVRNARELLQDARAARMKQHERRCETRYTYRTLRWAVHTYLNTAAIWRALALTNARTHP